MSNLEKLTVECPIIHGPKGYKGDRGDVGPQGDPGPVGATGTVQLGAVSSSYKPAFKYFQLCSNGTQFTVPPGINQIFVTMVGGGGGGGGALYYSNHINYSNNFCGGGGGGGACGISMFPLIGVAGTRFYYQIGKGGRGGQSFSGVCDRRPSGGDGTASVISLSSTSNSVCENPILPTDAPIVVRVCGGSGGKGASCDDGTLTSGDGGSGGGPNGGQGGSGNGPVASSSNPGGPGQVTGINYTPGYRIIDPVFPYLCGSGGGGGGFHYASHNYSGASGGITVSTHGNVPIYSNGGGGGGGGSSILNIFGAGGEGGAASSGVDGSPGQDGIIRIYFIPN